MANVFGQQRLGEYRERRCSSLERIADRNNLLPFQIQ
jgi:hypothetical protein